MNTTLSNESTQEITRTLQKSLTTFAARYPGESGRRQPVHTVYGGAHLFKSDTARRLGSLAVRSFETYAADAATFAGILELPESLSETIYARVLEKITREAVEDFRIDFEDGYGTRPDAEEDEHAVIAALEVAKGFAENTLPPFIGIRIKSFSAELHARSIRTLDIFISTLIKETGGKLPENFVVTLPKIVVAAQVTTLALRYFRTARKKPRFGSVNTLKMEDDGRNHAVAHQ